MSSFGAEVDRAVVTVRHDSAGEVVVTGHVHVEVVTQDSSSVTLAILNLGTAGWIFCTAFSGGERVSLPLAGLGMEHATAEACGDSTVRSPRVVHVRVAGSDSG